MAQTRFVVTAPLVIAKNADGGDVYCYAGAPVPEGQSEDWLERHAEMIEERTVADAPAEDDGSGSDELDVAAFLDRPAEDVIAGVPDLSDEQRAAAAEAEEGGAKRVTVIRALRGQ